MRTLVFFAAFMAACTTPDMIETSAERNAREFAADMNIPYEGLSCSARDNDDDGDVKCTLSLSGDEMKPIECNYDIAWAMLGQASGCYVVPLARGFSPTDE